MSGAYEELDAALYERYVPEWPGEAAFYGAAAAEAQARGEAVLEVACGTGRVAIPLARQGARVTGLDLSEPMLEVARRHSDGLPNVRWVLGDMRAFDLGERFGLALIPGHAFQNLLTPDDQAACLAAIRQHLLPGGKLIVHLDHQDITWLGAISGPSPGKCEPREEVTHPATGARYRSRRAWSYQRATQTATLIKVWEQLDGDGAVVEQHVSHPIRLHCVFRFEMEHLLHRAGFTVDAVYGNFDGEPLTDDSEQMIWVSRTAVGESSAASPRPAPQT